MDCDGSHRSLPTCTQPFMTMMAIQGTTVWKSSSVEFRIDCEEHSQELANMYAAFYDNDDNPRDWEMGEELQGDILYLNEIRLQPEWRGYGIGLLAIHGLLGLMPSFEMDAVILCPAGLTRDMATRVAGTTLLCSAN
ncbi:hypothetical protein FIBSPDRAFT_924124 [Athelia psychrophila]|uniref:N-acetyltransferase domain-containing protein n=1 Tax=Athelia psychrophila TaxID=1759441 RepID=A0A166XEA2_9AGAM|nr:hypothetical protein FIBSPDRAFT_924124 [Fibularhizoctonia sp. CBS 109695]